MKAAKVDGGRNRCGIVMVKSIGDLSLAMKRLETRP